MTPGVSLFGVRHHGPGSARSLARALDRLDPDAVLVEGPPEADGLLGLLAHPEMVLPAALMLHVADAPERAVFYPFAAFSPETVAIRHALARGVPVRFMDLPVAHALAAPAPDEAAPEEAAPDGGEGEPDGADLARDPLSALAAAAGDADGERWWERLVEARGGHDEDVFAAVLEAMAALREHAPPASGREARREAHMRATIRAARKEGRERIAVVCGAWHAPALRDLARAGDDAKLLKGLPKAKVEATWIPWTHGRLARESGYGAGVASPGWYAHLFATDADVTVRWMTRVARLLREERLDASSASVIEAVRLAETLASLRGRPLPGLDEVTEAAEALFGGGDGLAMRLVRERLVVGETLGSVPGDVPTVPLARDVAAEQRRLRLKPEALARDLALDLRSATDLARSTLLHRLRLLGVPWGEPRFASGTGTFREAWQLRWQPEFALRLVEAGLWGARVEDAAEARAAHAAREAADLPALTALLEEALRCALPRAAREVLARLTREAALATDVAHLLGALGPLARVARYGDVRGTDAAGAAEVFSGLLARACVGLPTACASLNDDAAAEMVAVIASAHGAVTLLQDEGGLAAWTGALRRVADRPGVHGLVAGRAARLLLDLGALDADEAAGRLGLALSPVNPPRDVAAWLSGFLAGDGLLLVHDAVLLGLLDGWLSALPPDAFGEVLPLLRRTFANFAPPERRAIGERVRSGAAPGARTSPEDLDDARGRLVLPLLARLLGLPADRTEAP